MQNNKLFLLLSSVIFIAVLIVGCAPATPNSVNLQIAYDDEMGKVLVDGEEVESGEDYVYEQGSTVSLKAEAFGGSRFLEWSSSGETQAEVDLVLEEDKMMIANFLIPLEVSINCIHDGVGMDLEEYLDVEEVVVEVLDADGNVVCSREKQAGGGIAVEYLLGMNVDQSGNFEVNVELFGTNGDIYNNKIQHLYEGRTNEVEIDLAAAPQSRVLQRAKVPTRPMTAESLTVYLISSDDALKYLKYLEIEHVSSELNRQARQEYTGLYDEGEVIFEDGEEYEGKELDLFPGKWELSLNFGDYIEIYKDVLLLLPAEEKEVIVKVDRRSGDFEVELIWDLPPAAPKNVVAVVEGETIKISWDSVDGADEYNLVRRETEGRDYWQPIETTTGNEFIDDNVTSGVSYQYSVIAVDGDLTSDYSDPTAEITF